MKKGICYIEAKTISDAWFQILYNILDWGYEYEIERGSFDGKSADGSPAEKGQKRIQFQGAAIYIEYPWQDMIPEIPAHLGIPAPTSMEYVQDYFVKYIMDPILEPNETYRYSSRIHSPMPIPCEIGKDSMCVPKTPLGETQLEIAIKVLKETSYTNQAFVEVGTPYDYEICVGPDGKNDPPCLRGIYFKVLPPDSRNQPGVLQATTYWRSWDAVAGFPSNLGGIELLKQYVVEETGLQNGPLIAYSDGLHVYGYQEELVRIRTMRSKE